MYIAIVLDWMKGMAIFGDLNISNWGCDLCQSSLSGNSWAKRVLPVNWVDEWPRKIGLKEHEWWRLWYRLSVIN